MRLESDMLEYATVKPDNDGDNDDDDALVIACSICDEDVASVTGTIADLARTFDDHMHDEHKD